MLMLCTLLLTLPLRLHSTSVAVTLMCATPCHGIMSVCLPCCRLRDKFGRELCDGVDPDQAVAMGAAIQARVVYGVWACRSASHAHQHHHWWLRSSSGAVVVDVTLTLCCRWPRWEYVDGARPLRLARLTARLIMLLCVLLPERGCDFVIVCVYV
jgi:hypothetical protein